MEITLENIKNLGTNKSENNLDLLIDLFNNTKSIKFDVKREVISSIGRQSNEQKIYNFIKLNVFNCGYMELVYQMYRTCLYKSKNYKFKLLADEIYKYFNNEVLIKIKKIK